MGSVEPRPVVIENTRTNPKVALHPAVLAFPNIGSYISVPIRLAHGQLYGTLCAVDPNPQTIWPQQIELLLILARLLATTIEHDQELAQRKRTEEQLTSTLGVLRGAYEQLERLNKTKSDLVSLVSHEFRTALTGIQGFSELMRDESFTLEEMKEYAADIHKEAKRLNRMITDELDLDRMESGQMKLHMQPIDLNDLIRDVSERARATAQKHNFQLQLDSNLPEIIGDQDKLTQVMMNLLNNAVKYAPNGGKITIVTRTEGNGVHVIVRDQGIGIPSNALEEIFERYARVESGATRKIRGTGLGLPIARQIVHMHAGKVWAESTMGEGTSMHFTLLLTHAKSGK
ncbi:MAG: hypothetical protein NVS4B12_12200 [Ktedonobacteraceae bacterium]